ncbi:MAG: hypothetical protein GWN73_24240, partial [Actinobacteria bacterium]|nr:hypothetical protein [Actinomycetota bacterium]
MRSYRYDSLGLLSGSTTLDASGATVEDTTVARTLSGLLEHLDVAAVTTTSVGVVTTTEEHYFMAPSVGDPGPFAHAGKRVFSWAADTGESRHITYDVLGNASVLSSTPFVY